MSQFSGRQSRGAMKVRRKTKREEAEARNKAYKERLEDADTNSSSNAGPTAVGSAA